MSIPATSASVRISTPASRAAEAMACETAPLAGRRAGADVEPGGLGVGEELDPRLAGGGGDGLRDGAHAAADVSPSALVAGDLTEDVMALDVCRAGGAGAGARPDSPSYAKHRL